MLKRLGGSLAARASQAAAAAQRSSGMSTTTGASSSGAAGSTSAAGASAPPRPPAPPKIKPPEALTPEELERALPSMVFTTSNLIWSTLVASGVAAAGLVSMVWLGTYIVNAADSMRMPAADAAAAAAPPPPPKPLAQLIAERRAEVEAELDALVKLPKTAEARARAAELRAELRQYGGGGQRPWWRPW